ncbi:hypothetical protein QTO34_005953 [Cnephaeus nilssonii]|uniref:ASPIC/UnbV domain-containing protein n=1 Tax=Cnephaeus nilssonii TaxID=3371016 RepID=A0AA40LJ60_CNENI|nr:hypothetical protein QTO34_005953 [Eptesicus nilssonii]
MCERSPCWTAQRDTTIVAVPLDSARSLLPQLLEQCSTRKDEASSVEVTWPDGKVASRNVASGEMNSVLEIPYPREEDRLQDPAPLEVRKAPGPDGQKRGLIHKPMG